MSMTLEEAIKTFEDILQLSPTLDETGCSVTEAMKVALTALRPVSREQVEQIFRTRDDYLCRNGGVMHPCFYCTSCGYECDDYYSRDESQMPDNQFQFCPCCGKAVTDEAVQMVMERLEALKNES